MSKPLLGIKIAILVANGFSEQDMTETQRALLTAGANIRVVSMDNGLVNGWHGTGWGHHFAVDSALSSALAADYDMLVIPGGQRSLDKLKLTAHTRRFIGGFMAASKPVAAFGDAVDLLAFTEQTVGRTLAGPEALREPMERSGAVWSASDSAIDGNLMSGRSDEQTRPAFIPAVIAHFASFAELAKAAA